MKNVKKNIQRFNNLIFIVLILFSTGFSAIAQAEFNDVLTFESDVDPQGVIEFNNRSFDAEIKTWKNNTVELQMEVKLKAKNQEDIDVTLDAIKSIEFERMGSRFSINTLFWESMNSSINHKLKLINGKKAVLKDFEIKITLFVPKTTSMEIDSKYADIKMEEIAGKAKIKIYSGKLYGDSFGSSVDLDMRYSKAYLQTIPEAKMVLYDSDIELATCGNLDLKSKYSKVEIEHCGDAIFNSYDDNISIGDLGDFNGSAKYSEFELGISSSIKFDFYDSDLKGGRTGNVNGQSKYSELRIDGAEVVNLSGSYDDSFVFGDIVSLECRESKYSDFEIEELKGSFKLQSYDDNVTIDKINPDFSELVIEGKYGDYRFTIPESVAYRLLIDMKYGKIDYPEELFVRKTYISENSNVFLDATTKNSTEQNTRIVDIKGHDNRIFIND